jgi:hypothetical protein
MQSHVSRMRLLATVYPLFISKTLLLNRSEQDFRRYVSAIFSKMIFIKYLNEKKNLETRNPLASLKKKIFEICVYAAFPLLSCQTREGQPTTG